MGLLPSPAEAGEMTNKLFAAFDADADGRIRLPDGSVSGRAQPPMLGRQGTSTGQRGLCLTLAQSNLYLPRTVEGAQGV